MNKGYFHSSGTLPIVMYPDRFHVQDFVFTVDGAPWVITSFTWQLIIKPNKGNNQTLLVLSLGNGLSFPVYETNRLRARFESAQLSSIGEGNYFWMLIKTDTNEPILKGPCELSFDPDAGGTDTDVTVGIVNNTVQVEIQSLLTGNSSGGIGSFDIVDYTDFESSGLPTGVSDGYIARLVFTDPDYQQTIDGVQYYNNKIIYFNGTNWISWSADVSV